MLDIPYDSSVFDQFEENSPDIHDYFMDKGYNIDNDIGREILNIVKRTMRPKLRMRVDQCADLYRYVTTTSSAKAGKYEVSTYEVARGLFASVTEDGVRIITAIGPTQLYKSSLLECTALYYALIDPKPMILVQPCFKDAIDFMAEKMQPMFSNTPAVSDSVYKTTKTNVLFTGGHLTLASASSENSLASRLAGVVLFDEVAKYKLISGRHPVSFGEKRLETYDEFGRSIRVSSPKTDENFIWKEYLEGDQRQPFVTCPHCGYDHVMRWKPNEIDVKKYIKKHGKSPPEFNVTWGTDYDTGNWDYESAAYNCPDCGTEWSYGDRLKALDKFQVKWRQTKPFTCCRDHPDGGWQHPEETQIWEPIIDPSDGFEVVGRAKCRVCGKLPVSNHHASFQASRLYSPIKLNKLVYKWKAAISTSGGVQSFVNDELAEPWKDYKEVKISSDGLRSREEEFEFDLPARCVIITAGIDVHPDRMEVEIVGWGRGFESWSIDYIVIQGRPDDENTLSELDEVLMRQFEGAEGRSQGISAACMDSGGRNAEGEVWTTRSVYVFTGQRVDRNIWPIKGASEKGDAIYPAWPKSPSTNNTYQVPLYLIGTTQLKNEIRNQMSVTLPGPRFMHFRKGRDISWYNGIISEKKVKKNSDSIYRWVAKDGARNEPIDCRCYALAALEGLKAKHKNPSLVEDLALKMGISYDLTATELERFGKDEIEKISIETEKSLLQNRAKPIKKRKKVVSDNRTSVASLAKNKNNDKINENEEIKQVASSMPNSIEEKVSDQRSLKRSVSPSRRIPPWERR